MCGVLASIACKVTCTGLSIHVAELKCDVLVWKYAIIGRLPDIIASSGQLKSQSRLYYTTIFITQDPI